jgi:hypothetical protein
MTGKAGETPEQKPAAGETPDEPESGETPEPGNDLAGLREALAKERTARRKFEADAKKNASAAQRLAEVEDADKSEVQKANDKAAAAEARAKTAEVRVARLEVAAAKGLGPTLAARLVGETREELEADADELMAQLKPSGNGTDKQGEGKTGSGGTPDSRGRPRESLRSGTAPDAEPEENDPTKLAALIPRG